MLIAVIEDDKKLNLSIKNILKKYNVDTFFDAKSFIESQKNYDLAIIDINLPDLNGLDIIKFTNKAIIISANITPENLNTAYKNGAIDFIKKPFFKEELLNKIELLFPSKLINLNIDDLTFNGIKLSKSEFKFLSLFLNKESVSFDEIYQTIEKSDSALYSFLSRLKKKTNLDFENIKGYGYKILI